MNALRSMKQSLVHPLDFFYDIQFDNRAKLRYALLIVALAGFARMYSLLSAGYSYSSVEAYQVSVVFETVWIVVPWLSWAIANWAVSSILEGEGKFRDILVSSAYVYMPYVLIMVPLTLLSNVLTLKELGFVNFIVIAMHAWMLFLILAHVRVLHDFELGKTVGVAVLSFIGMLLIWLVIIMVFGLVNQSIQFVIDIMKEISYRT